MHAYARPSLPLRPSGYMRTPANMRRAYGSLATGYPVAHSLTHPARYFVGAQVDGSGSISRNEFLEIGRLADLSREQLGRAFDEAAVADRRRIARTPGGTIELSRSQFKRLLEGMENEMLSKIREILPGMVATDPKKESLLVFDDGRQQLWRLVPGGRALVRKPVDAAKRGLSSTS